MKKYTAQQLLVLLLFLTLTSWGQQIEVVANLELKIAAFKEEKLYYALAAGDKIKIDLSEKNNREIARFEVVQYPATTRFSLQKQSKIVEELKIENTAVYVFIIKNNSVSSRQVFISIQREAANISPFTTAVSWITKQDTTWKETYTKGLVRYDTTWLKEKKWGQLSKHEVEEVVLDKNQRIFSKANLKSTKSMISFTLPPDENTKDKHKRLVAWAYWVGVDEAANHAWKKNSKIISSIVKGGASFIVSPLGAFAAGLVADLSVPALGEEIEYWISSPKYSKPFLDGKDFEFLDHGRGVAGFQKFKISDNRDFAVFLKNDNWVQGLDVNFKVSAIFEVTTLGNTTINIPRVTEVKGKVKQKTAVIKTIKVPVIPEIDFKIED